MSEVWTNLIADVSGCSRPRCECCRALLLWGVSGERTARWKRNQQGVNLINVRCFVGCCRSVLRKYSCYCVTNTEMCTQKPPHIQFTAFFVPQPLRAQKITKHYFIRVGASSSSCFPSRPSVACPCSRLRRKMRPQPDPDPFS